MRYDTAKIVNSCFSGKMGVKDYLKAVTGLFTGNIKDLALLTIAMQIPIFILSFIKMPAIVLSLIALVLQVVYVVSIIKLIDYRAKGDKINWIDAIKKVQESWLMAAGAIIFQSLVLSIAGMVPLLQIVVIVVLAVSIPLGTIGGESMISGAIKSFSLVKKSPLDVLLKLLVLSLIVSTLILPFRFLMGAFPPFFIVFQTVASIIGTAQIISSLVLFYNLTTIK